MTSKFSIDNRELLQRISSGEAVVGIDFGNLIIRELAAFRLAAMDSESGCLPLDYLQGQKDGLEWAAQLAEANHPETGDWLYDDPIELAKAIRKGPDMPPVQPVADSEPAAEITEDLGRLFVKIHYPTTLKAGDKLYRHAQPAPVVSAELLHTAASAIEGLLTTKDRTGAFVWFDLPFRLRSAANAQPAPVVPDAYVRDERGRMMLNGVCEPKIGFGIGWNACRAAMLAAAPQSPGSEPATVPGKWIPVSERMPDDDDFVYIWPRPDFGVELHVGQYCECSPKGDGWYAQVYEQNYGIEWHPITVTHWMPLPAGPKEHINALIPLVSRNEQEVK